MNLTVKHIAGTTCLLICEGDKTPAPCFALVEAQLAAAENALISSRAGVDCLGLEVHWVAAASDTWLCITQAYLTRLEH